MAKRLISPLIVLSVFTLAFMQMVYMVHTRDNTNGQCLYEEGNINGESLKICSLWDSFKIVYLLVIGEGFIGAEASSDNATIILLLVFVVLAFVLILHTISLSIVHLQRTGVKSAMVDSFWSPMLTHILLVRSLSEVFCCGSRSSEPGSSNQHYATRSAATHSCNPSSISSRLENMWDYILVSYSDVDIKDTKWWYLQRDLGRSHLLGKKWFVRIVGAFIVPIWICLGIVTLGILWPPQVRWWIFHIGMDKDDDMVLDVIAPNSSQSMQMSSLKSDISKMKMMLYERFQTVESDLYGLRSTIEDPSREG